MNGIGLALVAEAHRIGLILRVDGDRIKYRPAANMPEDLASRIKANRDAVIAVLVARQPEAEAPGSRRSDATRPSGQTDGQIRPRGNSATTDKPIRVRWQLDELDRRVLLELGILPTPSVDELPPAWRRHYQDLAKRLISIGVLVEKAEYMALRDTLQRMLACGELPPDGW